VPPPADRRKVPPSAGSAQVRAGPGSRAERALPRSPPRCHARQVIVLDPTDTRARLMIEGMDPALIHYWALDTLAAGTDTPAVRQTAEADVRDQEALHRHFNLALDDLGAPRLDETGARWHYARYMARCAVEGDLDAITAVRRIVWGSAAPLGQPDRLQPFTDAVREADRPGADAGVIEAGCLRLTRDYLTA
jgi:hypothetical protein